LDVYNIFVYETFVLLTNIAISLYSTPNQELMNTTIYKTSDYLTTDEIHRMIRYFRKVGNIRMSLLIEFGIKTLLRYSDLSRITWNDVLGKDTLIVSEIKTKKRREITLGRTLRERIESVYNELKTPNTNDLLFH